MQVVAAFKILDSDPKVKGILVNIFGGIVNCATVAEGIINAAEEVRICVCMSAYVRSAYVL